MEKVIISNNELINNLRLIENEDYIAIDTEFIRDTTYFSKLCLIQVASKKHNFIIDPPTTLLGILIEFTARSYPESL